MHDYEVEGVKLKGRPKMMWKETDQDELVL